MRSPLSRGKEGGDGCNLSQQVVASYHEAKKGFPQSFPSREGGRRSSSVLFVFDRLHVFDEGFLVRLRVLLASTHKRLVGEFNPSTYHARITAIPQDTDVAQAQLGKALVDEVQGRMDVQRNGSLG